MHEVCRLEHGDRTLSVSCETIVCEAFGQAVMTAQDILNSSHLDCT